MLASYPRSATSGNVELAVSGGPALVVTSGGTIYTDAILGARGGWSFGRLYLGLSFSFVPGASRSFSVMEERSTQLFNGRIADRLWIPSLDVGYDLHLGSRFVFRPDLRIGYGIDDTIITPTPPPGVGVAGSDQSGRPVLAGNVAFYYETGKLMVGIRAGGMTAAIATTELEVGLRW